MGIIKASASVSPDLDAAFAAALQTVLGDVDAVLSGAADDVARSAKTTAAFADKTGRLRRSIKKEPSKYENGGYIVSARAPHAHLVEFGHLKVVKSKSGLVRVTGHVPPHPFLRPALDAARAKLIARLQSMQGAANG